jgi:hypothetical protein
LSLKFLITALFCTSLFIADANPADKKKENKEHTIKGVAKVFMFLYKIYFYNQNLKCKNIVAECIQQNFDKLE